MALAQKRATRSAGRGLFGSRKSLTHETEPGTVATGLRWPFGHGLPPSYERGGLCDGRACGDPGE